MTEQLPIIINIHCELVEKFATINSACNKLAAQFNFQTLTANWYANEESVFTMQLSLETPVSFIKHHDELHMTSCDELIVKHFSDDVICSINEVENKIVCYIAMTKSELELLELTPKLLASFIQIKLYKVLNLIAKQCAFPQI